MTAPTDAPDLAPDDTQPIPVVTDDAPTDLPLDEPVQTTDEPDSFPRDYVTKLREEAAESRTAAKAASERGDELFELLLYRTAEQATAGILHDPSDLPREGDYLDDETGFPSADKIRAAAEALAEAKPWLARPRGDVSQGAHPVNEDVSFGDLIRARL